MRTLTRDTQSSSTPDPIEDISIKLSATTRRLSLIESHLAAIKPRPPDPTPRLKATRVSDHSTDYWRDSANTLSDENTTITHELSKLKEEYKQLKHTMTRSTAARKELELKLNEANKEIFHLSTTRHVRRLIPRQPEQLKFAVMPPALQRKDADHWYQTCRSMEAQYVQRTAELEAKVEELIETVSAKRRRTDAASENN
jgi:hypothetical protein